MPILSRQEFAKKYKLTLDSVNQYIAAGKIIEGKRGIDEDNVKNTIFIETYQPLIEEKAIPKPKLRTKAPQLPLKPVDITETKEYIKSLISEGLTKEEVSVVKTFMEAHLLTEKAKRDAVHERRMNEVEYELIKHKVQKQKGESVLVSDVQIAFRAYSQLMTQNTRQAIDNRLVAMKMELGWDDGYFLKQKKDFTEMLNVISNDVITQTQKMLVESSAKFAESKGVGEHGSYD